MADRHPRSHAQTAHAQAVHDVEAFNANAIDGQTRTVPLDPNASTAPETDGRAPAGPAPVHVDLHHNPSVFGTQGTTQLAADHQTQSFAALVVHLNNPGAQANIDAIAANTAQNVKTSSVLHDVGHDGFWEQTQWVAGKDNAGNAQGMLVLDRNNNGTIETADILHLRGDNNQTNSLAWLDSNGDGVLDAHDPAFAAIKVWVDTNNDGRVNDGEMQSPQLSSINFTTGQVNYTDGQSNALTATTLTADTAGSKVTAIEVVGADGQLHAVNAVNIVIGDWQGKADQAQHRHGRGAVEGALMVHAKHASSYARRFRRGRGCRKEYRLSAKCSYEKMATALVVYE